ncbi:DoxX family protein [uncultured Brevundimonas sp.]|uniref:DoxX family protein n=1 Tax=Brevundimonas sp. CEF1 TaxID=3442642 RepID=UPI000F96E1C1|nr:DoxX family protein [uncultured Brevundimonas sp.]
MTDHYLLIGRILLVLLFLQSGITKAIRFQDGLGEVRSKNIPFPHLALLGTVVLQIVGSALLIAGWFTTPTAALMALFTLATAVVFYDFWNLKAEQRAASLNGFFEHISIIGGFLILMAAGPGRFVL